MKLCITAVLCMLMTASYAQKSTLVFFTESGEKFTLYVNAVRQNETPAANVRAEGINADAAQVMVKFETTGTPDLKSPIMIDPGMEMTTIIKKNSKGNYVFRPVSSVPLDERKAPTEIVSQKPASQPTPATTDKTSSTSQSTTTNTTIGGNGTSIKVNVLDGQNNMNMDMNVSVNIAETYGTGVQTQTTVKETTTSNSYTENTSTRETTPSTPAKQEGCSTAMPGTDFDRAKKSIEGKSFSEEQMTICKQIIKANCLSVKQVIALIGIFTYEENKLEVAKLAYPKTIDQNNYYQVNDAFTYSTSVDELNKFLEAQ